MDALKFFKEEKRMCHSMSLCEDCPLGLTNNGYGCECDTLITEHPEKAIEIIEKWSKEHPQKTRTQDLLERVPNARMSSYGHPKACALHLGYCNECEGHCEKCWNRPVEEE